METIITYDISDKHTEFKTEMKKLGYKDKIKGIKNCEWIFLPNTTLFHPAKELTESRDDAKMVCKNLNIELERFIATDCGSWAAICGSSF